MVISGLYLSLGIRSAASSLHSAVGADVRLLVERPLESPPRLMGRAVAAGAGVAD